MHILLRLNLSPRSRILWAKNMCFHSWLLSWSWSYRHPWEECTDWGWRVAQSQGVWNQRPWKIQEMKAKHTLWWICPGRADKGILVADSFHVSWVRWIKSFYVTGSFSYSGVRQQVRSSLSMTGSFNQGFLCHNSLVPDVSRMSAYIIPLWFFLDRFHYIGFCQHARHGCYLSCLVL